MRLIKDICYSNYSECLLDIYLPESEKFCVFVYFHGGGLEKGDKTDVKVFAEYLVKNNVAVVSANYRMYPNAKYPEYILDSAKCVSWVFENISNYGKCEGIYVGGSSAGAYISMLLCFDKTYFAQYNIMPTDIAGYIHDAGQPTVHFNVLRERKIDSRRVIVDESAPIYHVGTETNYSKMLFIVSDNDMENRFEQTMLMQSTLKHFGFVADVKIMHGNHCKYINKKDENEESIFGRIIYSYINKWKKESE